MFLCKYTKVVLIKNWNELFDADAPARVSFEHLIWSFKRAGAGAASSPPRMPRASLLPHCTPSLSSLLPVRFSCSSRPLLQSLARPFRPFGTTAQLRKPQLGTWLYLYRANKIMAPQVDSFFKQVDTLADSFIDRLRKAVAIPSVSADEERRPDVVRVGVLPFHPPSTRPARRSSRRFHKHH